MTALEIRLAIYGFVLAALAGLVLYGKYERERADNIIANDKAAVLKQNAQDLQLAQDTINGLRNKLAALTAPSTAPAAAGPAPSIRVRQPSCPFPAQATAGGTQPSVTPDAAGDRRLLPMGGSGVSGAGTDIGGGVQDLALAGVLLATYRGQLWDWSVKQAQKPH